MGRHTDQAPHDGRIDAGLVADQEHDAVALRVDGVERGDDRRRAAVGEVDVLDHVDAMQVDGVAYVRRGPAEGHDQLVEPARSSHGQRVVEQRRAPIRQELLGLPEAFRRAGGQYESGDEHTQPAMSSSSA